MARSFKEQHLSEQASRRANLHCAGVFSLGDIIEAIPAQYHTTQHKATQPCTTIPRRNATQCSFCCCDLPCFIWLCHAARCSSWARLFVFFALPCVARASRRRVCNALSLRVVLRRGASSRCSAFRWFGSRGIALLGLACLHRTLACIV